MPVKGRSFGQERPPLTDLLKNILLRYPDGGQILKELIQNADDAGANEVKFLFDATSYGTDSLVSPGLALFQGPALYCYNNGEFTDEDWDGLQRLMRSNKANNPLKVGRFGIGFNSVYHITDLPSIVSGNTVAFLDPHEKYFVRGEPGQAFSTQEPLLAEHLNQFEPFHHIFDCNLDQGNYYHGTLFRFPLRTEPSALSKKIYTREMVNTLFDSFKNEASAILLFLKNVDSISLYEREARGEIVHLYTAKVSEQSKIEVRKKRQELIQDITVEWDFAVKTTFYRLEIVNESPGEITEKNEWFLANQVGTNENELIELARDLKLLPWIGIAFPLDANNNMSSLGRIFCFLPLPPDGDCRTGLPVQVNGYFGLTDNRRALKWPGPDCQNDDTARWNELLLRKVGSQVYANLILQMAGGSPGNVPPKILAELVYSALPILSGVRRDWKCIIEPFLRTVLAREIFLTAPGGICRWVNLGTAIIDRLHESKDMREEIKQVVLKTLLGAGQPIVSLPGHVIQIIDQYHQMSGWRNVQQVTPELLCNVLRLNFDFHSLGMPFEDRLLVLEYALQTVPSKSHSLHGVPLLPLENRQFIKFSNPSNEKVFIPSEKHSVELLPNMKHRFLFRHLSLQLQQKLHALGFSGATQLHHPTAADIKPLLWENLPSDWSCNYLPQLETVAWNQEAERHPSLAWLELVWKWINENYPSRLGDFNGMPLIPVSTKSPSSMARLRQNSTVIVSKHPMCNEKLSNAVRELLKRSGCVVVEELPAFVKHDQLLHYIALPNPSGVLSVLYVSRGKFVQQLSVSSQEVKCELCHILSRLDLIDSNKKSFIRTLPIFEAVNGRYMLSCQTEQGEKRLVAPRNYSLPEDIRIVDRTKILSSTKNESHRLLEKLGMVMESTASLIMIYLKSFLNSGIADVEKDKLVLWILEKIEILNQEVPNFVVFISQLACIPTASGKRVAPNQLFDPSDRLLTRLLQDNNEAFPTSQFSAPILKRKHELQVRRIENLTAQDVLMVVNRLTGKITSGVNSDRGMAVLELLNQRPQLLQGYTLNGRPLNVDLRELPWLPRMCDRPTNYPELMPWYDGVNICQPRSMRPNSLAILVGATVPVFDQRWISHNVQVSLCMSADQIQLHEVAKQLHLAIVSWTNQITTTPLSLAKFEEMVKAIYIYLSTAPRNSVLHLLQSKGLTQWVWHGNGFTSPEKVALESPFPSSINLHPYLFRLPNDLFKVKNFLVSLGVKPQFLVDDLLVMLSIIKEKHDNEDGPREDAMQDLGQCRAVLEWIVRSCGQLSDERRSNLLIPVHTASGKLQLEPCNKCTYCDREFLRRGASVFEVSTNSHLIHKAIPDDLAGRLRVPRLSNCLAGAKALGIKFKEAGQYEPLTTRLRNILQQYKEGVAIFKEIIQNADDARASKVCFVIDWRENPRERLLTEELAKCQGPALWAYNDAMFSEADFENINKLAGETKKEDLEKVGRFGLGFNSVYHLTDVPSFLSGEHVVVFDPNMTHISKLIDGKMRGGGFMLSLVESKLALSAFPDQFMPYHQMFGCDMSGTGPFHFDGTLFRLPFRTTEQARESEISKDPYTRENVNNLIKSLKESASTLLLFTQNVKEVRVFEIPKNSNPKKCLGRPLITVTKTVMNILDTNEADNHGKGTILENSSTWLRNNRSSGIFVATEGPRRTEQLKMNVSMVKSGLSESSEVVQSEDTWLVNSCTGVRSSLQVARSDKGRENAVVPVTGIAAKMTHSNIHGVRISAVAGEVFCFMPLSIESGFPVHVNGSFSVYSNRRRLWEEGVGEHRALKPFEAKWNEALMEDSLAQAYLQLLRKITTWNAKQYEFHSLWPNPTKVNYPKAWKPFISSFFNKIIDEEWPLFYCNGKWRRLHDCLILDPKLGKVAECVAIMNLLDENVLSLPKHYTDAFVSSGKEAFIKVHMLTEDRFLREFFFPNISQIPNQNRNSVLVHILDRRLSKHRNYDDLLRNYPSFSCSKDGTLLRKPNELVHPKGKAASLFSEEEKRFPLDDRFLTKERAMMLEELGMAVDSLPWCTLCERAEWISNHCDVVRGKMLIQYLNQMPPKEEITSEEKKRLRATQFLPVLSKPKDYPFSWKSENIRGMQLAAADYLYSERHKNLVGSTQLILDESSDHSCVPNRNLKVILGFISKQPELPDVIAQLDQVIQLPQLLTREKKETMCSTIYEYLQRVVTSEQFTSQQSYLREQLDLRPWMLVRNQMVHPKFVAKNWNKEDTSPYLFPLPPGYSTKFKRLIHWCGIKENFSIVDLIEAIRRIREDTGRRKLIEKQISTIIVLLEEVFKLSNTRLEIPLPLPSSDCLLYDGNELVINYTPWLETDGSNKLVHEKIPPMLAHKCGAKQLRKADLLRCSQPIGKPFGQHEELTDRLKNILAAYPPDEGILKELLQNADDAKASEVHFIFDPRKHGTKHVFSDSWNELQGPAICVYNDKPFSKEDIEGIQKLGIGSKVDDPMKTGQYGIGFNAVYHLTDCPSFISNDEVICVSDPHAVFAPGADERNPGRLFNELDGMFRRNYQDVFAGFLGDLFPLKGSTMFRFPLRSNSTRASKISSTRWYERKVKELFDLFRASAKDMLLFLNNIIKISVSVINDGKLETYSVKCDVSDMGKRIEFYEKIRACSKVPTRQIEWQQIHYVIKVSDTNNVKKDWLITQSLGSVNKEGDGDVPDGTRMGLLPRAGIAIRLPSNKSPFRHSIFCVLPLPVSTRFPVHINGHFALDSARRGLWYDPKSSDERDVWNNFMKRQVIAPAYAKAIHYAKEHIPGYQAESVTSGMFSSKKDTEDGLKWYHQLFPSIEDLDTAWKPVGEALYRNFLPILPVLPVAMSVPESKKPVDPLNGLFSYFSVTNADTDKFPVNVTWFKVTDAYFCTSSVSWYLENSLLSIGFLLLSHAPRHIHESFKAVKCYQDVSPDKVFTFLKNHADIKASLPRSVEDTILKDANNVIQLTRYCSKAEEFYNHLEGFPLLLTQDDGLRCFDLHNKVFCTKFSQLLPSRPDLFMHNSLRGMYESEIKKCSNVLSEFCLSDLAQFQANLFPPFWINSTSHQPWNPNEKEDLFPSKEWLILLWQFIDDISSNMKNKSDILKDIVSWHIIPTTQNCLAPVSMGKTVLNVSTYLNSDSHQDKDIRELVMKIGCPQLNHTILISTFSIFAGSGGATEVRKHYLAMIQSTKDVLGLLHNNLNHNRREVVTLENHEIERLMMFLQTDLSNLSCPFLRNLPFYQTIDSTYTRLSTFNTVYEVPAGVPGDDLQVLSTVTNSIFLRHCPKLADLYKYIGIEPASSVEFYLRIVLKHFNRLTPEGRENHLKYVRDHLLNYQHDGYNAVLAVMEQLPFLPHPSGALYPASEFYNPDNKIFKTFVQKEDFPPSPFDSHEWKDFLKKVGLQCVVTSDHFLRYAQQLEQESRNSTPDRDKEILEKSKVLVTHLFDNKKLQKPSFLSQISKINFVPTAKVLKLFREIHPSHTGSILTCFNGSVVETHATLVWSCASLIRNSALPYHGGNLVRMLGIHTTPPHQLVIAHLKNISGRFPAAKKKEVPGTLQTTLSEVMTKIYSYFEGSCGVKSGPPGESCSQKCHETTDALRNVSVVLVDRHTFVRGNQLAFAGFWESMKPYMFNVPRNLQNCEHFLKCLRAQERPTQLQYSSLLEVIKRSCEDNQMHPGEITAAAGATKCLFMRLSKDAKRLQTRGRPAPDATQSLANVRNLYLPTEDNYLKRSCEVFVNDTMEKKERLKDYWKELLIDLTMKDQEPPAKLVEFLPSHLKVQKLSSKLNEELCPSCTEKICILDQDSNENFCPFIKPYRDVICSQDFSEALVRLYKFQEDKVKIPEEVRNDLKSLENGVQISCMQTIEIRLVTKETAEPVPDSMSEVPTFCEKNSDGFRILIKHGGDRNTSVLHERISSFIAMITGQHVKEANWRFLMMVLDTKDPSEISRTLDDARIPRSISSRSREPNPGEEIPEHFHYLLKNDINYHLREGEFVGYEVREEDEENEAVYVYAKIIEQTSQGDGTFGFSSKYKIDIGEDGPIEVNKLKLYKFDREERKVEGAKTSTSDGMDLVAYLGPRTDNSAQDNTRREPATLEEAKREVAEALKEIWESVPESERSSAVKRLIRRWHPDKNPDDRKQFATEVTQFLLNEVDRLNAGGVPGYHPETDNSNQTPRRPRDSSGPGCNGHNFWNFYNRYTGRTRDQEQRHRRWRDRQERDDVDEPANQNEGERWMRQSQNDLEAAAYLLQGGYYSLTCFHSQQAVEKALKALMFAKGRLKRGDLEVHEVLTLAYRASGIDPRLRTIPIKVTRIQGYYIKTRYPHYRRGFSENSIPAENYTYDDANDAISQATDVRRLIREVLN
ncbi:sacsin-like [Dendronephthya gigantea]|uniref:sacsin-like n=1 Tax=Dendronephthya gigantea TaxID=151771 RepID=UPI00106A3BB9|nr:sacsin-like [Dendronephthya gigantea]